MDFAPSFFSPNVLKMNGRDTDSWTRKDTPPHTVWRMSCQTPQASGLGRAPRNQQYITLETGDIPSVLTSAFTPI